MGFLQTLILALGLAMDAVAVYLIIGMSEAGRSWRRILGAAAVFGGFQMAMPAVGFFIGEFFDDFLADFIPWVTAGLFALLGIRMIVGSVLRRSREPESPRRLTAGALVVQAAATSLDSLAVGFVFVSAPTVSALLSFLEIGLTTFAAAILFMLLGRKFGMILKGKAEIAGGLILIGLAVKILAEQLLLL